MFFVPLFLRFNHILLIYASPCQLYSIVPPRYSIGSQPIAEKCELFCRYLSSIKLTLRNSEMISFVCKVDEDDPSQFRNASALLDHIRHILSICNSSREYFFELTLRTDSNAFGNVIASILEMPTIASWSHVCIASLFPTGVTQLPIEVISNWLNREHREIDQNQQKRRLILGCFAEYAHIQEMCDFLKQVAYIFKYLSPNSFRYKRIHLKNLKFCL